MDKQNLVSKIIDNITNLVRIFKELNELPMKLKLIKERKEYKWG